MMTHVMVFQFQPEVAFKIEMMNGEMRHVIKQIAADEADEKRIHHRFSRYGMEQKVKQSCKWNADGGNHHEPLGIARIIMVNTVHDKMNLRANFSRRHPMENKPVQNIFSNRPDTQAENNHSEDYAYRKMIFKN